MNLFAPKLENSGGTGCNTDISITTLEQTPHLEYAAPVWDPSTAINISKLEDTQTFALGICTRQWNMGYLDLTNCPTLQSCRLYILQMCTTYIYNYFPSNVFILKHNSVVPTPLLHQPFAQTMQCILFIFCPVYLYGTIYPKKPSYFSSS